MASWPPTFNINTTFLGKNGAIPSLLAWGTDGLVAAGSVIAKSVRAIPMIEEIKIEQGSGLTATQQLLNDGDEYELVVEDDRAVSWPAPGTPVTYINPQPNGTGGTSEVYMTVNNNWSGARKTNGERSFLAKRYSLITPVQM